jgi:hypothetical protein
MRGSKIIVSSEPQGKFLEGVIGDTSKPGTKMQIQAGTALQSGRLTFVHAAPGATGDPAPTMILLEDDFQGFTANAGIGSILPGPAYVAGTRCRVYCPIVGEVMNVLCEAATGTGSLNSFTIGGRLVADNATGTYIQQATAANNADFVVQEHIDEVPVDTAIMVWVIKA